MFHMQLWDFDMGKSWSCHSPITARPPPQKKRGGKLNPSMLHFVKDIHPIYKFWNVHWGLGLYVNANNLTSAIKYTHRDTKKHKKKTDKQTNRRLTYPNNFSLVFARSSAGSTLRTTLVGRYSQNFTLDTKNWEMNNMIGLDWIYFTRPESKLPKSKQPGDQQL